MHSVQRIGLFACGVALAVMLPGRDCKALQDQDQDQVTIRLADQADLNIEALVRFTAETLGFNLMAMDSEFQGRTNLVKFYGEPVVSKDVLLELVQAVLRRNGLALVDSDVPNWKQVIPLANIRPFVPKGQAGDFKPAEYLTEIFQLKYITPDVASQYINSVLFSGAEDPQSAGLISELPAARILIVTDLASRMQRIEELINRIDVPQRPVTTRFLQIKHLEADELVTKLKELLSIEQGLQPSEPNESEQLADRRTPGVPTISADLRTNRLIVIGTESELQMVQDLVAELDVPLETTLTTYGFRFISAQRIDDLIRQSLAGLNETQRARVYHGVVDVQSNQLIVTARTEIHQRIVELKNQLDKQADVNQQQSPIRFYTLKNVKVTDILETLQSIERTARYGDSSFGASRDAGVNQRGIVSVNADEFSAAQYPYGAPGPEPAPMDLPLIPNTFSGNGLAPANPVPGYGPSVVDNLINQALTYDSFQKVIPGEAKITVDENSNTLIVVAEPSVQALYAELIDRLDRRRPQVLVEVAVVTIDASDNYSLGIELSGGDRTGARRLFAFTSFGLSTANPVNGALSLLPGTGLNATLIQPDDAEFVLRALASHSRARVIAAPRVLVNDHATGTLSSVAEVPYAGINASNVVATTSLGGFAEAGTTVEVTPHISEDTFLNLEFDIQVSDFTGAASENLPPARRSDQVTSEVTIPDRYTVVVGGLNRKRNAETVDGIPIIEQIPLLRLLSHSETFDDERQMIFVFIKPIILRDDKFKDLQFLSEHDRECACIPGEFPQSQPVIIR